MFLRLTHTVMCNQINSFLVLCSSPYNLSAFNQFSCWCNMSNTAVYIPSYISVDMRSLILMCTHSVQLLGCRMCLYLFKEIILKGIRCVVQIKL